LIGAGSTGADAYSTEIIGDGPYIYWRLADTGSTAADEMGNQDGTITGFTRSQGTLVTDGDDSMLVANLTDEIVGHTTDSVDDQEVTFEVWMKWSSIVRANRVIAGAATHNTNWGYFLFFLSNGQLYFQARKVAGGGTTSAFASIAQTDAWADGNPHHIVATHSKTSGLSKLYVDGSLIDTSTEHNPGDTIVTGNPMSLCNQNISAYDSPTGHTIDEFAYYRKVLDGSTITSHYNTGTA